MKPKHKADSNASCSPFQSHGDVSEIACIDNWMGFDQLAGYYLASADALVESAVADSMLRDVHVYAACFLYRHACELILKDLIWKAHYAKTGKKCFMETDWQELGRHRLSTLWQRGLSESADVLSGTPPVRTIADDHVTTLLAQFEEHDPSSDSFRYPIGKRTGRTHPKLTHVNLDTLRQSVHLAYDRITSILDFVEYHYDQRSEWERDQQSELERGY